ncbi:zinc-dependent peptidase [Marinigracilibium pacificum]|uniref:Peptidase n=1 Tax=Marinigracilibium pacificum TaxID=2729599 RepID=A0A848IWV4_9BACT|nr:zinc-dependent peptidase [Marinigracilibium pacificum]NMM48146.1 peptidase [Marinigracilibium pacificum]
MAIFIVVIMIILIGLILNKNKNTAGRKAKKAILIPDEWKSILKKNVAFYNALSAQEKTNFEVRVYDFLSSCKITGVKTKVELIDRILIAASAIIPVFSFKNWQYPNIEEVLLYPNSFDHDFNTEGGDRRILGMVGTGYMEGKMILSRNALITGFENESDKKNTAIHEFIHLIDKADGVIDGVPSLLLDKQYTIPWLDLINKKIGEIEDRKSDINPYGGTNNAEFFSVASEYFFERPKLMEKKHPKLYKKLEMIFMHDMSERNLDIPNQNIGRNSPCPCNSGKKYKRCCG